MPRKPPKETKVVQLPGAAAELFHVGKELKKVLPEVFRSLVDEAKNGKGISRIQALKTLKEWASEVIIDDDAPIVIAFDPIGDGGPQDETAPETKTA